MRIAIATDAWQPQTNGVIVTLKMTGRALESAGHEVRFLSPEGSLTVPMPTYPDIRLAFRPYRRIAATLDEFRPHSIHIATEGPVGRAARRYCIRYALDFTTAYHTRFPQYIRLRAPVPERLTYALLRRFHSQAVRTMVPTESQRQDLTGRGFRNIVIWSRGVDTELFRPREKGSLPGPRPMFVYSGRVAVEKNLDAFLSLDLPGTKYVIGDGPDMRVLREKFPAVRFTGFKYGEDLAGHIAAADVFVFPSRTDTFGLVLLEAMACGVPVAAYPIPGPADVVRNGITGILDDDLRAAALGALDLDGADARRYAESRTWSASTAQFLGHLAVNAAFAGEDPVRKTAST